MLSNPEIDTLTEMLHSGYRLDGRSLSEYREISFRFPRDLENDNDGCCIVKIGATSVMARVSAEIVEPKHFRPSQGTLFVNFDANLVQLPRNLQRKQNRDDESRRLSSVLQTLLRDSIDLDALCIVAWERVFAIRVELRALSYDGNLGDCGALAAIAAMASFRRPDVFVHDDGKVIVDTEAKHRPRIPLSIRRIPVLVTLGLSADSKVILQDPTAREESILTGGRVLIGMTGFSEVCCLYTTGLTSPIRSTSLARCVRIANSRAQSLVALVQRVLDGLKRQREVTLAASHARASELERVLESSRKAPLVLSSCSFLPDEVNAPKTKEWLDYEEGEVIVDNDAAGWVSSDNDDMDVVEESEDEHAEKSAVRVMKQDTTAKPATHLDLYGVIEVSSKLKDTTGSSEPPDSQQTWDEFDGASLGLPGISFPELAYTVSQPPQNNRTGHSRNTHTRSTGSAALRGEKKRASGKRKGQVALGLQDEEEEEHVAVVKLT